MKEQIECKCGTKIIEHGEQNRDRGTKYECKGNNTWM
jgi:predicted RNA-binding Zn-ribbon protein involved in translation (DUF1610 family)